MKKKVLMKLILIISMIGIISLVATQAFAEDDPFLNFGENENVENYTKPEDSSTNNNDNPGDNDVVGDIKNEDDKDQENPSSNQDSQYQNAGIGNENIIITLMIVSAVVAIFAYIKLRYYRNI